MKVPQRPTSVMGRLTWHLRHPLVALVCLSVLILSAMNVPRGAPELSGQSWVWVRLLGKPLAVEPEPASSGAFILRTRTVGGSEMRLIDTEVESWDLAARMIENRPEDMLQASYGGLIFRQGVWYPSREFIRRWVTITPLTKEPNFTPEELNRAREVFVEWLRKSPQRSAAADVVERLGVGEETVYQRHWAFVWWNLATLIALLLLGLSVAGMPRYLRVWIATRRGRLGLCGVCKYDLREIQGEVGKVRCPECGGVWDEHDLGHRRAT